MNAKALENKIERLVDDLRRDQYATAHRRLDEVVSEAGKLQAEIRNRMGNAIEEHAQMAADLRRELESLGVPEPERTGSTYPEPWTPPPVPLLGDPLSPLPIEHFQGAPDAGDWLTPGESNFGRSD